MRLATFVDPQRGNDVRFGIVRGDNIVDVVAAANTLQRAVPAMTVKAALTSGAHVLKALDELVQAASAQSWSGRCRGEIPAADSGPSKFFCVGKNNKKHREELQGQQDADGGAERADRLHQADRHDVRRRRRGGKARRYRQARLRAGALLRRRQARPWREEGRSRCSTFPASR
jgi:hypothetical protein